MSVFTRPVLGFVLALLVCSCSDEQAATEEHTETATSNEVAMSIDVAQDQLTAKLISMPGVVGIGTGDCDGEPCIRIMLEKKTPDLMAELPASYEGYPVVVEETGEIWIQE